ncbi:hypothetical protein DRQ36_09780 [bacterium]|nr:MAG: hypothetical protein DRQ36_09780 [bacterium]
MGIEPAKYPGFVFKFGRAKPTILIVSLLWRIAILQGSLGVKYRENKYFIIGNRPGFPRLFEYFLSKIRRKKW